MKRSIIIAVIAIFTIIQAKAQKSEIFISGGSAIKGYDPVAFFKESKPVKGVDSLSFQYKGATWLFSNRENLNDFMNSPEKYAPQYGGYCAYGASQGRKLPTQTETWTVYDDKLFFNYSLSVKKTWLKDQQNYIKIADQKWPEIKDKE